MVKNSPATAGDIRDAGLNPQWTLSFPGGTCGKEFTCHCRRHKRRGFEPSVGQIPWRRARPPTLVFLPEEFHGQMSLARYSSWGHKELDTTEAT